MIESVKILFQYWYIALRDIIIEPHPQNSLLAPLRVGLITSHCFGRHADLRERQKMSLLLGVHFKISNKQPSPQIIFSCDYWRQIFVDITQFYYLVTCRCDSYRMRSIVFNSVIFLYISCISSLSSCKVLNKHQKTLINNFDTDIEICS